MPEPAFDIWLAQDYRFVADLLRFQARLLGRTPRATQHVLAGGLVALVDELAWFEQRAAGRHIDLEARPLRATMAYGRLLERLDNADFPVALTMLWTLERTYLDAWSYALPGAPAYQEFVAHWTTPQFAMYVAALQAAADDALRDQADVDARFIEVLEAEIRFWDIPWEPAT
jgi:thiaminase/transcriptional activator TenA